MRIKANGGISAQNKIDAGIRPLNRTRMPKRPPADQPVIAIVGGGCGKHTLRYVDPQGGPSTRMAPGAAYLEVHRAIADAPVRDVAETRFHLAYRRNPIRIAFANADDGKVATYFARWADAKGRFGPWSMPVSMRIAA